MDKNIKAIAILEQYYKLLLNQTTLEHKELQSAIKELKDLEHFTHYTGGLWATDRPDLFANQIKADIMHQIDFWKIHDQYFPSPKSFAPYVDETVEPAESYLVFCENHSPWNEDEHNMVRVNSNAESHKMLDILEKHFGIPNLHKKK